MTVTQSLPFFFNALYVRNDVFILGRVVVGPVLRWYTWKWPTVRCFWSMKRASIRAIKQTAKIVQLLCNSETIEAALHTRTLTSSNRNRNEELVYSCAKVFTLFERWKSFGILKWCGAKTNKLIFPWKQVSLMSMFLAWAEKRLWLKKTALERAPAVSVLFAFWVLLGARMFFQLLRTFAIGKWDSSRSVLLSYTCVKKTFIPKAASFWNFCVKVGFKISTLDMSTTVAQTSRLAKMLWKRWYHEKFSTLTLFCRRGAGRTYLIYLYRNALTLMSSITLTYHSSHSKRWRSVYSPA